MVVAPVRSATWPASPPRPSPRPPDRTAPGIARRDADRSERRRAGGSSRRRPAAVPPNCRPACSRRKCPARTGGADRPGARRPLPPTAAELQEARHQRRSRVAAVAARSRPSARRTRPSSNCSPAGRSSTTSPTARSPFRPTSRSRPPPSPPATASAPIRSTAAPRCTPGSTLPGRSGTPIYATADGTVSAPAGISGGYGNLIKLDHGRGIETRYGHLSAILVHAGQHVTRGQLIARMGSTGRSTGSHLHYEVRIDGRAVNPIPFMKSNDYLLAMQTQGHRHAFDGRSRLGRPERRQALSLPLRPRALSRSRERSRHLPDRQRRQARRLHRRAAGQARDPAPGGRRRRLRRLLLQVRTGRGRGATTRSPRPTA